MRMARTFKGVVHKDVDPAIVRDHLGHRRSDHQEAILWNEIVAWFAASAALSDALSYLFGKQPLRRKCKEPILGLTL
jgi:hypothetical protein